MKCAALAPALCTLAIFAAGSTGLAEGAGRFETVAVSLEQNIQDGDAEVRFEAIGDVGLASLKVAAPDGRTVVDFRAPDSKLGLRHITLETPEPKNDGQLQADFPEGTYRFTGTTAGGRDVHAEATLSHKLPKPVAVIRPQPDEEHVSVNGLRVTWHAVAGLAGISIVIEDEKAGREIKADLAGTATSFGVPDGFLLPGTEYKLAVGAVAASGNRSFVETSFTTAAKR